jgi:predicted nucleic acid-binding protein
MLSPGKKTPRDVFCEATHLLSFWDGLILAAAHIEEAATLWPEDLNRGQTL